MLSCSVNFPGTTINGALYQRSVEQFYERPNSVPDEEGACQPLRSTSSESTSPVKASPKLLALTSAPGVYGFS
jgi:hypothetical protein